MGQVFETMVEFFSDDEWPFTQIEEHSALRTSFGGDSGEWTCYAQAQEEQKRFLFYSICPVKVPEEKRVAMAEFLTRANYGLITGNFEMDFSDGEIRYKASIDVKDDRVSAALIRNLVYANVLTMDRYLPGIMSLTYGDVSPAQAIALVDGDSEQHEEAA